MNKKYKHYYVYNIFRWIGGFASLIDDVFVIITLGFWSPKLRLRLYGLDIDIWQRLNNIKREKNSSA